jgi:hypothetical protein
MVPRVLQLTHWPGNAAIAPDFSAFSFRDRFRLALELATADERHHLIDTQAACLAELGRIERHR